MYKTLITAIMFLGLASLTFAQGTSSSFLAWDQPQVATATEAQALTYKYYPDGSPVGVLLTGVTCSGTPVVTCRVAFPAFTPGQHSLTITASNLAGESPKSTPFGFEFVVIPGTPINIRIQ